MSLKIWLPLTGDLHNQGCSNITPTNVGATINSGGKIGSCYNFAGSGQRIKMTNPITNGINSFSICTWFYMTAASEAVWGARTSGSGAGLLCFMYADRILFDDGARYTCSYNVNNLLNAWHHITCIKTPTQKLIYIDGILVGTQNTTTVTANIKSELTIGNDSYEKYTGNDLIGKLNDFRVYDHSLTPVEVKEISQGLVLHYKFDDSIGFTDLITRGIQPNIYNNHNNTNMPSTLVANGFYNGDTIWRETCTPTDNSLNSIKTALSSHGIYKWSRTFSANTKYVFWIYYKPISHADTRCGGTASNIGGWTEIPPVEVGGGWYRVGQYRNGTVTSDKTDNIFVSFKVPSATTGTPIIIDWASPHLLAGTTEIPPNDFFISQITDSSGYGHHGTNYGAIISATNSARQSNCLYLPNGNTDYIYTDAGVGNPSDAITMNIWFKSSNKSPGTSYHHCFNGLTSWCYIEMAVHKNGYLRCGLYINGTRYVANTSNTNLLDGNWHMLTMTYNGSQVLRYVDGVLRTEASQNATGAIDRPNDRFVFGRGASTGYYCKEAYLSDARIYATALSARDIITLYQVGARIDNVGNLHIYEINENGSNKLKNTGVFYNYASEPYMQLSDGSYWKLLLFHQVDNGNNLFTSSNATYNNGFGLYSRLRDIDKYTYDNKYEFYVIQDGAQHRWTQTNAPMTTTSVAGFTAISGSPGGGICKCKGNTVLAASNTTSNWWRACGCWTKYQGGIPGFNSAVCKGSMALYVRISAITFQIETQNNNAKEFIEI